MSKQRPSLITKAPELLECLKAATEARIALGRCGPGLPTAAVQGFLLDHARARQAVWRPLDVDGLERNLTACGGVVVHAASRAVDRAEYLRRPDLGRALSEEGRRALAAKASECDVAFVIADGLSATAVEINAAPLVAALLPLLAEQDFSVGPVTIATQARVALGDDAGVALGARTVIVIIGERPGLSAADSLGVYMTHAPEAGLPDSRRNCISNIRDGGLPVPEAAAKVMALLLAMRAQATSGIDLVEQEVGIPLVPDARDQRL